MIEIEKLKTIIINKLKPLNPKKVILFGSHAYGKPNDNSDIDLYIVTNDDFIPQTWREKSDIHLKISNALKDFIKEYPTDIITHTNAMHKTFLETKSMFSKKIINDGIRLI